MSRIARLSLVCMALLISCGGPPPIRQANYPIDCRKGQPIKELIRRGDVHRNLVILEKPPENTNPEQWPQIRKLHASRARTCYQLVLDNKPDHFYVLLNSGFISLVESTFTDQGHEARDKSLLTATNYIQQALKAQQLDAQSYYYLGEIAARRGQCDKALRIFTSLLTSRWSYSHVYAWMGYCHELLRKPKEAQDAYRKAAEISNPLGIAEWARSKIRK
jgi:tetratricopeptide (TPR) repeat protein